jgi:type 1 glutamine amidotransferase
MKMLLFVGIGLTMASLGLSVLRAAEGPAGAVPATPPARKLKVLVITGGHGFDTKAFPKVFADRDDIEPMFLDTKTGDDAFGDIGQWKYDVIVLYNYGQKIGDPARANFLALMDKGVGLVILHHAIAAYPSWPEFDQILGGRYHLKDEEFNGALRKRCTWKDDVDYKVRVEDPSHPIVAGLTDFAVKDETYKGYTLLPETKLLLTTDEKLNNNSLAWTKTYRQSRVCFIQLGHGPATFAQKEYRQLVAQAIRWTGK